MTMTRRNQPKAAFALCSAAAVFLLAGSAAAETTTQVTTYVIKTQEERESTRWTLTEWLRIKERMKLMDVWLAMFSDPKKDKFSPELMLNYGLTQSKFTAHTAALGDQNGTLTGSQAQAQLWLTNLISSTIGVRTLNIDLGLEGAVRQSAHYSASATAPSSNAATPGSSGRKLQTAYYSGDLRIFGRNIQDSSLVLKYGAYTASNSVIDPSLKDMNAAKGPAGGADLQLYVFRALGIEGGYLHYGDSHGISGSPTVNGSYYDYDAFIEVSLLRLYVGAYDEQWHLIRDAQTITTQEKGYMGGIKLQL